MEEKKTGHFNMRVGPKQKKRAAKLARKEGRTLADWTLRLWAEQEKPKNDHQSTQETNS